MSKQLATSYALLVTVTLLTPGCREAGVLEAPAQAGEQNALAQASDETAALKAAIANAPKGGTVVISEGVHLISSTLVIDKTLCLHMNPGTVLRMTGANLPALQVSNASKVRIEGGKIELAGSGATGIDSRGKGDTPVDGLTIQGVTIEGDGTVASHHQGIANSSGQTITNLRVLDNTVKNLTVGISVNADEIYSGGVVRDALIQGNHVENIVGTEPGYGYGIHAANVAGMQGHIRIVDNFIMGAQRHSIYAAKGDGVTILGNHIRDHRTGQLQGKDTGHGNQRPAINIARGKDILVQGNIVENVEDGAMAIDGDFGSPLTLATNVTVTGNLVRGWGGFPAFALGDCAQTTPLENDVEGILIQGNQFLNDASGIAAGSDAASTLRICHGRRIFVLNNYFEMLNPQPGNRFLVFKGMFNTDTETRTDDVRVANNTFHMAGPSATPSSCALARLNSSICDGHSHLDSANNRSDAPMAFDLQSPLRNPNVRLFDSPTAGLVGPAAHALGGTVTGSRGGNEALAHLISQLQGLGVIADGTSP